MGPFTNYVSTLGQPNANLIRRPFLVKGKRANKVSWLVKKLQNCANVICERPLLCVIRPMRSNNKFTS